MALDQIAMPYLRNGNHHLHNQLLKILLWVTIKLITQHTAYYIGSIVMYATQSHFVREMGGIKSKKIKIK